MLGIWALPRGGGALTQGVRCLTLSKLQLKSQFSPRQD
jgi:hypothetical protein